MLGTIMSFWRREAVSRVALALLASFLGTCAPPQPPEHSHVNPVHPSLGRAPRVAKPSEYTRCLELRQAVARAPALPGTPELDAARPEIVARARTADVLFIERPEEKPQSPQVETLRTQLHRSHGPWPAFHQAYLKYRRNRAALRQVFLSDGYLYAERPDVAALLGNHVLLNHLFDGGDLVITRGEQTLHATKKGFDYVWTDGPELGKVAHLWLFDRVSRAGEAPSVAKHVSIERVREQAHCDRIEIERLTPQGALAQLVYDDVRTPAVLTINGNALKLECQAVAPDVSERIEAARTIERRRTQVMAKLRQAIADEVAEGLPFDEPKTEEGQQDGKLRHEWRDAYLQGRYTFTFNGDKYFVFGSKGQPRIPQVCVDFVVDTWERLAGTRWLGAGEGRGRHVGRIDFNALDIENRRSVDRLIEFARNKPQWFDVLEYAEGDRVPFLDRKRFFKRLFDHRRDFQPGDVVAILGRRDDDRLHYHSFIIVSDDPLTGMPTTVAANAGRPRVRSWEAEMQNAPKRSIIARIRPRLAWLEALADPESKGPAQPLDVANLQASARQ
jgi:hypothetical protein